MRTALTNVDLTQISPYRSGSVEPALLIDPITGRLLTQSSGGGPGTGSGAATLANLTVTVPKGGSGTATDVAQGIAFLLGLTVDENTPYYIRKASIQPVEGAADMFITPKDDGGAARLLTAGQEYVLDPPEGTKVDLNEWVAAANIAATTSDFTVHMWL